MESFENLYNEINNNSKIKNIWEKARKEEKQINKKILIINIFIIIILVLFIRKFIEFSYIVIIPVLFILSFINILMYIVSMFFRKEYKKYKKAYKNLIIESLISNFYDDVNYLPEKGMPREIYDEPRYNEFYNKFYSDDYIEGKINNKYNICMAEIKTEEEETIKDKDGTQHTTTTIKFHGIFAKTAIDKSINSELKIEQNGKFIFTKNKLEMDSSEFEKYFDVVATNKIIGMQLLTADVMEDLIDFQNKTHIKFNIVIKKNSIYLRFHCGTMFEPDALKKGVANKKQLEKYYNVLNFTYNLSRKIIKLIHETEI